MATSDETTTSEDTARVSRESEGGGGGAMLSIVFGGAVVALAGFLAAWLGLIERGPDPAMQERLDTLEADIAAIPEPEVVDLSPLEQELVAARQEAAGDAETLNARLTEIETQLAGMDDRLTVVERQPSADGTLTENAIASWEQELDGLRAEIATQQTRMDEIAQAAQDQLAATQERAAQVEQDARTRVEELEAEAEANARRAMARAALGRVQAALETGVEFEAAVQDLQASDVDVPDALVAVSPEGVATLQDLRETFPDAARAALAIARSEGEGGSGVTGFLSNQFSVRSVAPRDGDDADAVLSRAEAALNDGRIEDALAELDALSDAAGEPLAEWRTRAETRIGAVSAARDLDQTITQ